MKISIQVALEHGVIFIYDPYENYELPPDTGKYEFTYTESCICFWVPSYIDGNANIIVSDLPFNEKIAPSFSGMINASGKSICIADPAGNYYCMLRIDDDKAIISIWNYQQRNREFYWVQIKNLDTF